MIVGLGAVAFASLVALWSLWALWKMLRTGMAPTFTEKNAVRRDERPALFWSIALGRLGAIGVSVWFAADVIADFGLSGIFQ